MRVLRCITVVFECILARVPRLTVIWRVRDAQCTRNTAYIRDSRYGACVCVSRLAMYK